MMSPPPVPPLPLALTMPVVEQPASMVDEEEPLEVEDASEMLMESHEDEAGELVFPSLAAPPPRAQKARAAAAVAASEPVGVAT